MTVDAYASVPWYHDHLAPIFRELGTDAGIMFQGRRMQVPLRDRKRIQPPTVLVASYGDFTTARRNGYKRFIVGQHGAGQSYAGASRSDYPSYPGGRNQAEVGMFLVPNEHAAGRWRKAYPRACVAVVGCPKLDTLPKREPGPGPVVAVSFHWDFKMCPETMSAFSEYQAAIPKLVERYKVIGHGHPRRPDLDRYWRRLGVERVESFAEVCRRADVYVCDNSSTMFEFAANGGKVVTLNAKGYRRNVEHGLRFWAAADVGVQVDHPADLLAGVARAIEDPPDVRAAREAALDIVYTHRTGAARRAADAIRAWTS